MKSTRSLMVASLLLGIAFFGVSLGFAQETAPTGNSSELVQLVGNLEKILRTVEKEVGLLPIGIDEKNEGKAVDPVEAWKTQASLIAQSIPPALLQLPIAMDPNHREDVKNFLTCTREFPRILEKYAREMIQARRPATAPEKSGEKAAKNLPNCAPTSYQEIEESLRTLKTLAEKFVE